MQRHLVLIGLALQCPEGIAQVVEFVCLGRSLCINICTDLSALGQFAKILSRTPVLYIIGILLRDAFHHPLLGGLGQVGSSGTQRSTFIQVHGLARILLVGKHVCGTWNERYTVGISGKGLHVFLAQQVKDCQI